MKKIAFIMSVLLFVFSGSVNAYELKSITPELQLARGYGQTNHKYEKVYKYIDNSLHYYNVECTNCDDVASSAREAHKSDSSSDIFINLHDPLTHIKVGMCKYCEERFVIDEEHTFVTNTVSINADKINHYREEKCKKCGYVKSTVLEKHTYRNGVCRECGYINDNNIVKGDGVCEKYLNREDKIYLNCPDCGAYECEVVSERVVKRKVYNNQSIYHTRVKCSICGNEYYNKCYLK